MKKILTASILSAMLAISAPAYSSGFPTIDVAQVTQQLMAYLKMIDDFEVQLNQQLNQIEHLQQIEVPGMAEYKRLKNLSINIKKQPSVIIPLPKNTTH